MFSKKIEYSDSDYETEDDDIKQEVFSKENKQILIYNTGESLEEKHDQISNWYQKLYTRQKHKWSSPYI